MFNREVAIKISVYAVPNDIILFTNTVECTYKRYCCKAVLGSVKHTDVHILYLLDINYNYVINSAIFLDELEIFYHLSLVRLFPYPWKMIKPIVYNIKYTFFKVNNCFSTKKIFG